MMRLIKLFMAASSIWLAACAGNPMVVSADQTVTAPGPDKAQIVFMRSSFYGSAINASLFEVKDEQNEFIGIMANGTKIVKEVEPGEHLFMVVSEAADFMKAELEGGKTYYAMVTPRMGAWKARFSFQPIKKEADNDFSTSSDEFGDWVTNTKLVENSETSLLWARNHAASIDSKRDSYIAKWLSKDADEIARQTLEATDGL
ncbi:DUF2846 domain-containing protein [Microbulbifer litoralis]|uniref:DUF2846 domain-containing protein n=1 Tax=Microbulbifer litoralis TaxID=2933965 RepID=UPI002028E47C|nr:DUF2846 domain-containing protein [Microbulbifer sp. GX H0434]